MKKRQMMVIAEINRNSFVFFFERKKNNRTSWSIRDYSIGNNVKPKVYRPIDRPWTADDIHQKAQHPEDAPTVHTNNLAFWHKHTLELNKKYPLGVSSRNGKIVR
jgi:hypothetical protein